MATYPKPNDRDWNLLKGILENTAALAVAEAGDVASITSGGAGISVNQPTGAVIITNTGVTSITGTANQITVSASTGAVTISLPTTLAGINSITSVALSSLILATGTSGTAITIASATNIATFAAALVSPGGTITSTNTLKFGATALATISVSADTTAGRLGFVAPSSGFFTFDKNVLLGGLTTNGTGVLQFASGTTSAGGITLGAGNFIFQTGTNSLAIQVNSANAITIANTAKVTFYNDMTIGGFILSADANSMMRGSVTWANGAGASLGTLTNAPAAGNPTKWIPVVDNGTTRYVPAW